MKLNEVKCPGIIPAPEGSEFRDDTCGSHEITFGTPLYKDREYDEVIIEAVCDSCGHQFQVHGRILVDKVDDT